MQYSVRRLLEISGNPPSTSIPVVTAAGCLDALYCFAMAGLHSRNSPDLARGCGRSRAKHARDSLAGYLGASRSMIYICIHYRDMVKQSSGCMACCLTLPRPSRLDICVGMRRALLIQHITKDQGLLP